MVKLFQNKEIIMTTGIYKLEFKGTQYIYIGQSLNIEKRFIQHLSKLANNTTKTNKLQLAYNMFGVPKYYILEECDPDLLLEREKYYINLYNSVEEGFNTLEGGYQNPIMQGLTHPNSKYTEEDYYNVLYFLGIPGYSWKEIEDITGVSKYVISHISSLESHRWLKTKFPEEYAKIESIYYGAGRQSAYMQGKLYPRIESPSGEIFEVKHQTNFAKEHNLLQPKLCEVLKGTRKTHKGWKLAKVEA